ncbi:MAG: DUF63 family protein [Candidatus Nanohaloarchaea archaeon]
MPSASGFAWKYLVGPVVADARGAETATWNSLVAETGYNIFNTVSWAVLAAFFGYAVYRHFEEKDIRFDRSTVLHSLPFVVLGGVLRFLEDAGSFPFEMRLLLITPVIYFVIAGVYLSILAAAERYAGDRDRFLLLSGTALTLPFAVYSAVVTQMELALLLRPFVIAGALTLAAYLLLKDSGFDLPAYHAAVFSQFFGGAASMVSVSQGYTQKQLLAQQATEIFGAPGILVVKAGVLGAAFYVLRDVEDERVEALLLLALIVVGLATGLRVALRLSAGL